MGGEGEWEGKWEGEWKVSGQSLYHPEKKMIKIYGACLCDVSGEA